MFNFWLKALLNNAHYGEYFVHKYNKYTKKEGIFCAQLLNAFFLLFNEHEYTQLIQGCKKKELYLSNVVWLSVTCICFNKVYERPINTKYI